MVHGRHFRSIVPAERPCQLIDMNSITKLPEMLRGQRCILTGVDTFSRMVHWIPARADLTVARAGMQCTILENVSTPVSMHSCV